MDALGPEDAARVFDAEAPLVARAVEAIRRGDLTTLTEVLEQSPELAAGRVADARRPGESRTLLHVATDWPGRFPNGPATVSLLVERGARPDAPFHGSHRETALHWAASTDDVPVLDRLLDLGADIDARGGVIAGGTPLADAVAFGQWRAAHRLVERGAHVEPAQAAALGLLEEVRAFCADDPGPDAVNALFWMACHGGRQEVAAELARSHGAEIDWLPPWERATPLDAAQRGGFEGLAEWLRARGARRADETPPRTPARTPRLP